MNERQPTTTGAQTMPRKFPLFPRQSDTFPSATLVLVFHAGICYADGIKGKVWTL